LGCCDKATQSGFVHAGILIQILCDFFGIYYSIVYLP